MSLEKLSNISLEYLFEETDRLWPRKDTAVQQQYFGTLWRTKDASAQENIPHMTPPPAGTDDTKHDGYMLFTLGSFHAINILEQKPGFFRPGGVLSLFNRPLLPITSYYGMIVSFSAVQRCIWSWPFVVGLDRGSMSFAFSEQQICEELNKEIEISFHTREKYMNQLLYSRDRSVISKYLKFLYFGGKKKV